MKIAQIVFQYFFKPIQLDIMIPFSPKCAIVQ